MKRILVTGATGNIGREVVAQLRTTNNRVRAMTRSPASANLPEGVDVVRGDLTSDVLDDCLAGVDAVFLVWTAPIAAAAAAVQRIASHAERIVLLSSPHRTEHPFFQQPNALRAIHAAIDQMVEASGLQWTVLRPSVFALNC
ncbi:MAG TPA: NAD(P)H-binding protein, partial [Vicinamibacterales bacterium]|nr:NAD(P)H-binding protein [Vicinamibacterales bacterium]